MAFAGICKVHPICCRLNWKSDPEGIAKTISQQLKPGSVFFDIGANLGQMTLVAATKIGELGKIVAFEPSQKNLDVLKFHVKHNGLSDRVIIVESCAGNLDGTIPFSLLEGGLHTSNSYTFEQKSDKPFVPVEGTILVEVPITKIDSWCEKHGLFPDFMKVDVEGAEFDVLKGATHVLKQYRPVMLVGVHPFWWPDGQSEKDLMQLLEDCDYCVLNLEWNPSAPTEFKDYLCVPKEKLAEML